MTVVVSVLQLAEFVHRRGDLYPPLAGRTRAEEGVDTQRKVQRRRPADYISEQTVAETFTVNGIELKISGRVDGCRPGAAEVEEIKTTRADPADAQQYLGSLHWSQLRLYASLLARTASPRDWTLVLTYCHPDTLVETSTRALASADELAGYLDDTLAVYASWLQAQQSYRAERDRELAAASFPYASYRPHQRAMARRVFQAFRTGERLLLEAPTGSGKTMGMLYPAAKALAAGLVARLFYLTSRGTGALAALDACESLATATPLRYVELIAKATACAMPGTPCDAERCPYARGYFDRIRDAVPALLARGAMHAGVVREVAEAHQVCPFELSLDAALWADVIIGDYNYLLDPVVRLQRFAQDESLGLLIDESHQLADRARSMLSLQLSRVDVRAALAETLPVAFASRLRALDRALLQLRRDESLQAQKIIAPPESLLRAITRVCEALASAELDLEGLPATRELVYTLSRWVRAEAWREAAAFAYFGAADNPPRSALSKAAPGSMGTGGALPVEVSLECLDPGPYLHRVLGGYGPHVRFSGTLTPLALYQRGHGHVDHPSERVESAFSSTQMGVLVVADLSVLYRDRASTLTKLVDLVASVCRAHPGNYLVALPSFDYLESFTERFRERHPEVLLCAQQRRMAGDERSAFVASFSQGSPRLGIVVLGGVFAESVDFSAATLSGIICVGVGIPPVEPVREAMADYYESAATDPATGVAMAYEQPAMSKIVQMAGRLLRGPSDRGVLCLVDGRFRSARYQRFFPVHWQPRVVESAAVPGEVENFWRGDGCLPRLAAGKPAGQRGSPGKPQTRKTTERHS